LKKAFPYIIGSLVLVAALVLVFAMKRERQLDERLTFNKNDKIPYGTYVAYHQLKYLFPDAGISSARISPEYWDTGFYNNKIKKALIIVTPQFMANETEMNNLVVFAQKGNDVFISTRQSSVTAQDFMKCRSSASFDAFESGDSVTLSLNKPPFPQAITRTYPGRKYQSYFYKYDSSITSVLGYNDENDAVFIRFRTGEGNIYLHVAPIAFTNYFLLHKNNMAYYNEALSVIPYDTKKIIWDEYFLYKLYDHNKDQKKGWLDVLFKYPPFKWGLMAAMITTGIYVLLEMRRKQRYIPAFAKPGNDSLDFVKTIGRLYYEKNDHRDLAKKMGLYFLDHVRNTYKMSTGSLDDSLAKTLHIKSGHNESKLKKIISFINFVHEAPGITDLQLAEFHEDLEDFYRNT
jgi:hypothetical protein